MTPRIDKEDVSVQLSVIVVSVISGASLEKCLDSILANESVEKIEIIVADSCSGEHLTDLVKKFSSVSFRQFPEKTGIPRLSASAIAESHGKIIALSDSSCEVDQIWISSILNAHKTPSPVIGGRVEVRGIKKLMDWAAYFCEYGQFMHPLRSGVVNVVPGNNISFKRETLAIGSEFVIDEFWKTCWCQELQANGIRLISEPSILVFYTREFKFFQFLVRRFNHGRCFAARRVQPMSFARRIIFGFGAIFLPMVFLYRTAVAVLGKKRFLKEFLLSLPFIGLAILFWSVGESCGYLAGAGKSCDYIN